MKYILLILPLLGCELVDKVVDPIDEYIHPEPEKENIEIPYYFDDKVDSLEINEED